MPLRTLDRFEAEVSERARAATLRPLVAALTAAGVQFIDGDPAGGPGVRLSREAALREAVGRAKGRE